MDLPFEEEESSSELALPNGNISKNSLSSMAKAYVANEIEGGETDIIDIYIKAKGSIELMNAVLKESKEEALKEVSAAGKEGIKFLGVMAEEASVAATYSFDHDIGWKDRKDKLTKAQEELTAYQDAMKQAMNYEGVAIEGEVVLPAKVKGGGTTIKVTIPKK